MTTDSKTEDHERDAVDREDASAPAAAVQEQERQEKTGEESPA